MDNTIVSVVKCKSYNKSVVRKALNESLRNIDFKIKKGAKILIKPNLLFPSKPEAGITTHPVIIEELCRLLKKHNAKIFIGESSAYSTDQAFIKCGIVRLAKYATIINFENEEKKIFNFGKARNVPLPKILFDSDVVINVAKMKTHGLTGVTLCVKNLYGCIPGESKQLYHKTFSDVKDFSHFLAKIEKKIKPTINIIDGVTAIEGEGPGANGKIVKSRIIITSKNPFAADIIASEIMGFDPYKIWTNRLSGIRRDYIIIVGNGSKIRLKFKKPKSYLLPFMLFLMKYLPKSKIKFDLKRCRKCHLCEIKCPAKAIKLKPWPECDHKRCIRCLCCIEICPHKAVYLREGVLTKLLKMMT